MTCHEIERRARVVVKKALTFLAFAAFVGVFCGLSSMFAIDAGIEWWWGPLYALGTVITVAVFCCVVFVVSQWLDGTMSICKKGRR